MVTLSRTGRLQSQFLVEKLVFCFSTRLHWIPCFNTVCSVYCKISLWLTDNEWLGQDLTDNPQEVQRNYAALKVLVLSVIYLTRSGLTHARNIQIALMNTHI